MIEGLLVFLDVDTQRDFMEPEGALYVPGARQIVPVLSRLTGFARRMGVHVVATSCAHRADDPDPEPFPPHCLVGTPGQSRADATDWPGSRVLRWGESLRTGRLPEHLTLEKRTYDVFDRPDATAIFERYGAGGPTFIVYGVATDYCVQAVVHGLLGRGFRVGVVVDAIRPIDRGAEPAILTEFTRGGACLLMSDVVCGSTARDTSWGP